MMSLAKIIKTEKSDWQSLQYVNML